MKKKIRILQLCTLLLAVLVSVAADADADLPKISLRNPIVDGSNHQNYYYDGYYFLIPGTVDEVRQKLERGFQNAELRGFQWKDDTAALSNMEHPWIVASFANHPELKKTLDLAADTLLDKAQKAGVISADEKTNLLQAIPKQDMDYAARRRLAEDPFFEQRISRWEFRRSTPAGVSIVQEDFGYVMDVSPILAREPMVLVWYGGLEKKTKNHFKVLSNLDGVGPIPDPHIEKIQTVKDRIDQKLQRILISTVAAAGVPPDPEVMSAMQSWFAHKKESTQTVQIQVPTASVIDNPATHASIFDVPGSQIPDYSGNDPALFHAYSESFEDWNMLLLPDGQLLISTFARMQLFNLEEKKMELLHDFQGQSGITSIKLDYTGRLWGLDKITSSAYAEQSDSIPKLLSWTPDGKKTRNITLPGMRAGFLENWLINPEQNVAFWTSRDITFFNLSLKNGELSSKEWMVELREAVIHLLNNTSDMRDLKSIKFNDGLIWRGDWDGYGVSAETGRVVKSVKTTVNGMFFGSLESRWGLAPINGSAYSAQPVFIINLDSGLPYLKIDEPVSQVARTAHGRLLALSDNDRVIVIDMKSGMIVAKLVPDTGYKAIASAFTWKGDKLWIYLRNNDGAGKVMIWDVPESLRDASSDKSFPDQTRLNFSAGEWR